MYAQNLRVRFQIEYAPVASIIGSLDYAKHGSLLTKSSLLIVRLLIEDNRIHILLIGTLKDFNPSNVASRVEYNHRIEHLPRSKGRRLATISHRESHGPDGATHMVFDLVQPTFY